MNRIDAFLKTRNDLYSDLNNLIVGYLIGTDRDYIYDQVKDGQGWISNIADGCLFDDPKSSVKYPGRVCSVIVSTSNRNIPFIFIVDKKLTHIYEVR